jgi:hypothetical protein
MAQTGNPCRTWDLTVSAGGTDMEQLKRFYEDNCSKWVFQKERGEETGFLHFQCRFTLKNKTRWTNLRDRLHEELGIYGFHLTATSKNCIKKDEDYYVTKEKTRIEGPWKNEDTSIPSFYRNATLKPWQQEIVQEIEQYVTEGRQINLIVNTRGNEGKSFLSNYLRAHKKIYLIPPLDDYKDVMQYMMCRYNDDKAVFIDVPRGLSEKTGKQFYSAIETIKGGFLYDTRYRGRDMIINPPCIYVFCNYFPNRNFLSWDRWNVRELRDGILVNSYLFLNKKVKKYICLSCLWDQYGGF